MSWLTTLFKGVKSVAASPQLAAAETTIKALMPVAITIVSDINAIAPNKTLSQINLVATKYALPAISAIADNPQATGNTLLNLATTILQKNHAPTQAVSLLNTVVQLAVTAVNAQPATPAPSTVPAA